MNTSNTQAQTEQETSTLDDLHRAFAGACLSYGAIVNNRLDAEYATNTLQFTIAHVEKLDAITKRLFGKICGAETVNYPAIDAQRQPPNLTPTFDDLHRAFADACYSYGVLVQNGLNAENVTNHLQWLAAHTEKLDAITKQLLGNVCGGVQ